MKHKNIDKELRLLLKAWKKKAQQLFQLRDELKNAEEWDLLGIKYCESVAITYANHILEVAEILGIEITSKELSAEEKERIFNQVINEPKPLKVFLNTKTRQISTEEMIY